MKTGLMCWRDMIAQIARENAQKVVDQNGKNRKSPPPPMGAKAKWL